MLSRISSISVGPLFSSWFSTCNGSQFSQHSEAIPFYHGHSNPIGRAAEIPHISIRQASIYPRVSSASHVHIPGVLRNTRFEISRRINQELRALINNSPFNSITIEKIDRGERISSIDLQKINEVPRYIHSRWKTLSLSLSPSRIMLEDRWLLTGSGHGHYSLASMT